MYQSEQTPVAEPTTETTFEVAQYVPDFWPWLVVAATAFVLGWMWGARGNVKRPLARIAAAAVKIQKLLEKQTNDQRLD